MTGCDPVYCGSIPHRRPIMIFREKDLFIKCFVYDSDESMLEVYPRDYDFWYGIEMDEKEYKDILKKSKKDGVFFHTGIRHVLV